MRKVLENHLKLQNQPVRMSTISQNHKDSNNDISKSEFAFEIDLDLKGNKEGGFEGFGEQEFWKGLQQIRRMEAASKPSHEPSSGSQMNKDPFAGSKHRFEDVRSKSSASSSKTPDAYPDFDPAEFFQSQKPFHLRQQELSNHQNSHTGARESVQTGGFGQINRLTSQKEIPGPAAAALFLMPTKEIAKNSSQQNFYTFKHSSNGFSQFGNANGSTRMDTPKSNIFDELANVRAQIDFYQRQIARLQVQSTKFKDREIELAQMDHIMDDRIEELTHDIITLNKKLEKANLYQQELNRLVGKVTDEKAGLIREIRDAMTYQQNTLDPKPEEIQIYNQLQKLERRLRDIENEGEEELQLSELVTSAEKPKHIVISYAQALSELYAASTKSGDPKLVYNFKLASLKKRWVLFENEHLQVGVVFSQNEKHLIYELHLGNKTSKQLASFSVFELPQNPFPTPQELTGNISPAPGQVKVFYNELLGGRSFLRCDKRVELFFQTCVNYRIIYERQRKYDIPIMVPTSFMHFGEFQPLQASHFSKRWKDLENKQKSETCPVDKKIVKTFADMRRYIHNLQELTDKSGKIYFGGVFVFSSGPLIDRRVMIKIKEKSPGLQPAGGSSNILIRVSSGSSDALQDQVLASLNQSVNLIFGI